MLVERRGGWSGWSTPRRPGSSCFACITPAEPQHSPVPGHGRHLAPSRRVAVQLPGRADRFGGPAYDRVEPLIEVLRRVLEQPFALYGTSMCARVTWTLSHALRARALPRTLYLASDPAPRSGRGSWNPRKADAQLACFLHKLGSTPSEALDDPETPGVLLPTLRADLTLLEPAGISRARCPSSSPARRADPCIRVAR
ncbi:thioesterase II family protein [Solwaraspora sp. WMMB762]|uniref:thioesterase II family protein n=1 Tax=Solwaraspora sp. WMMB762 TaxID=3404120 RepID=UPI003B9305DD